MTNRSGTTTAASPDCPDLDNFPPIRRSRPRPPLNWPGGEPDSVRRAYDAERLQAGGTK